MSPLLLATGLLLAAGLAAGGEAGRMWIVAQADARADDAGPGDETHPFRSIGAAAARAEPGDTVLVHAGVYREQVAPERGGEPGRPITYRAAPGETVAVRGSEPWQPAWEVVAGQPALRRGPLPPALARPGSPYRTGIATGAKDKGLVARPLDAVDDATRAWLAQVGPGRLPRTLGQLFVDGEPLREVESLDALAAAPGTWLVDAAGDALLVHPPAGEALERRLVELSVRDRVVAPRRRGLGHIALVGLTIEHCANQGPFPQIGMVSPRSGAGWTITGCTIRHAKTIGLDIGSEHWDPRQLPADTRAEDRRALTGGGHRIIGNRVERNGLSGIAGLRCPGSLIAGNIVEGNNALGLYAGLSHGIGWWEQAGIKLHFATDVRIEGNLVRGNDAFGIWIDNGFTGARITRNTVIGNRLAGICLEMGHGPVLVDRNIISHTEGDGFYAHDSSGVTLAHNLIAYSGGCGVWMHTVTARIAEGRRVATADNRILANLLLGNRRGALCLPPPDAPGCTGNRSDGNAMLDGAWLDVFCQSTLRLNTNDGVIDLGDGIGGAADKAPRRDSRVFDLAAWRQATGWDRQSLDIDRPRMRLLMRALDLSMEWEVPDNLAAFRTEAVPGVDTDWHDRPWPADGRPAGPFADLRPGRSYRLLWPAPAAGSAP